MALAFLAPLHSVVDGIERAVTRFAGEMMILFMIKQSHCELVFVTVVAEAVVDVGYIRAARDKNAPHWSVSYTQRNS